MCPVCVSVLGNLIEQLFPPDRHYKFDTFGKPIGTIELKMCIAFVNSKILRFIPDLNFPLRRRTQKEQAIHWKKSETKQIDQITLSEYACHISFETNGSKERRKNHYEERLDISKDCTLILSIR